MDRQQYHLLLKLGVFTTLWLHHTRSIVGNAEKDYALWRLQQWRRTGRVNTRYTLTSYPLCRPRLNVKDIRTKEKFIFIRLPEVEQIPAQRLT